MTYLNHVRRNIFQPVTPFWCIVRYQGHPFMYKSKIKFNHHQTSTWNIRDCMRKVDQHSRADILMDLKLPERHFGLIAMLQDITQTQSNSTNRNMDISWKTPKKINHYHILVMTIQIARMDIFSPVTSSHK